LINTVDLRLSAATQMTANPVDRIHIACFGVVGEQRHQFAVGLSLCCRDKAAPRCGRVKYLGKLATTRPKMRGLIYSVPRGSKCGLTPRIFNRIH